MSSELKNINPHVSVNSHSPNWRIFGQNPDMCLPYFLQRCRTFAAIAVPNLCFLCVLCGRKTFMTSAGKNIHKPVLANPHSLDWNIFGQNPDVCLPCFLESCRTSGALVEPNLCDYVFYVSHVVEKPLCPLKEKIYINPFW
jgi:hypothetical protein